MNRYTYLRKYRKYPKETYAPAKTALITDERLKLAMQTDRPLAKLIVGNEVMPVILIPLVWDSDKQMYVLGENPPTDLTHIAGQAQTPFDLYTQLKTMLEHMGLAPYPLTDYSGEFYGTWGKTSDIKTLSGYKWSSNDTSTPASVSIKFYGTKFALSLYKSSEQGKAIISVDEEILDTIDLYEEPAYYETYLFTGLTDTVHTLKIQVSTEKNPNATGYYVTIGGIYFETGKNSVHPVDMYMRNNLANINNNINLLRYYGAIFPSYSTLTTIPLIANGEFTGNWEDREVYGFSYILVLVYSDQNGKLYIEQSHDGNTVIRQDELDYTGGSTSGNLMKVQVMAQYVRVRYVNGATDQSTFVLTRRYSMA